MPRISVIIPAYNAERTITSAIRSVQGQTEADFEIIVVDDASTDTTCALVQQLADEDRRVRLIRLPRNAGPGVARNEGVAVAAGEWIGLLDADDRYRPDRLRQLLNLADDTRADMAADNILLCPGGGPPEFEPMFAPALMAADRLLSPARFVEGNIAPSSRRCAYGYLKPILRREFLAKSGILYNIGRFGEDFLFYLQLLLFGARWVLIPEALYEYNVGSGTLTFSHTAEDLLRIIEAETTLLENPAVRQDAELTRALIRHRRTVSLALSWFTFAKAVKRFDVTAAASSLFSGRGAPAHIGRELLHVLSREMARLLHSH